MYVSFQRASYIANDAEITESCVFWYFYFFFFFNRNFTNVINQLFLKLHENLFATMKLRKYWLNTLTKMNKYVFWDAVNKIVVQLRKDRKSLKAEMTVTKFVER